MYNECQVMTMGSGDDAVTVTGLRSAPPGEHRVEQGRCRSSGEQVHPVLRGPEEERLRSGFEEPANCRYVERKGMF